MLGAEHPDTANSLNNLFGGAAGGSSIGHAAMRPFRQYRFAPRTPHRPGASSGLTTVGIVSGQNDLRKDCADDAQKLRTEQRSKSEENSSPAIQSASALPLGQSSCSPSAGKGRRPLICPQMPPSGLPEIKRKRDTKRGIPTYRHARRPLKAGYQLTYRLLAPRS